MQHCMQQQRHSAAAAAEPLTAIIPGKQQGKQMQAF
jgi:hypothetical protein